MDKDLNFYKVWRKLCKKIPKNISEIEKEKIEESMLNSVCNRNEIIINNIRSFYIKSKIRKSIIKQREL